MYRLIIVDDEAAIRRGMCNYIPWNDMGFHVVSDFEDGKETIDYISKNKVDVIVTDIEMAEVTGLDLIGYIHEKRINIKVVILSGYKRFEYAKKALEYKVEYYLLKPIHLDEVKEVFGKIKYDLDHEKEKEQIFLAEQENFQAMLSELQEQFFVSLLVGGIRDEKSIQKKCELLRLNLKMDQPYALLDFKIQQETNDISCFELQETKKCLLYSMFGQGNKDIQYYIANLSSDIIKVIAVSVQEKDIEQFTCILNRQIREKSQVTLKLFELKINIHIDFVFHNMEELLEHRYNLQMHVQEESKEFKLVPEDYKRLIQKYKMIIETINDMDFEALDSLIDTLFFEFRNLPLDYVKHLIIDMFSMLSAKFIKIGSELWMHMNDKMNYQDLMDAANQSDLKKQCKELLRYAGSIVDHAHNDVSKTVVSSAMKYIKEFYGEDVSLETVADHFFLNPSYFSRLFKQYSGVTFTDYLVEIRMNEAKKLIAMGKYKVYEISQMVGYKSEKYFFRVFKQNTGCAPSEYYRSRVLKDG